MKQIFKSLCAKTGLAAAIVTELMLSNCQTGDSIAAESGDRLIPAGLGYAQTSVNTVPGRHNSIVTEGNTQYIAFYDGDGNVMAGKRTLGDPLFEMTDTGIKGVPGNAHNNICIMTDGDGYVHLTVNYHNGQMNYYRGDAPGSLNLSRQYMIGKESYGDSSVKENQVTYTEFYRMPSGDLLLLYRDGVSGNGDMVLNRYRVSTKTWTRVHDQLVYGEGVSPYWQMYLDANGTLHLSWVLRNTGDASTNHDMYYAYSTDEGDTWLRKSDGSAYTMPIYSSTAEKIWDIPVNSNLINGNSMTADQNGNPYIATYWGNPQVEYRVIYHDGTKWNMRQVSNRKTTFFLGGSGTLLIPVARPRLAAKYDEITGKTKAYFIFRDAERGARVSMYSTNDISSSQPWKVRDLTDFSVYGYEPSHDTELWKNQGKLHVYVQYANQVSGDGGTGQGPMPVYCLEVDLNAHGGTNSATYAVVFHQNGGGGGTAPEYKIVDAGSGITLPGIGNVSKAGYFFGGWNTNADGTGKTYDAGSSFKPTSNITLYAKWSVPAEVTAGDYTFMEGVTCTIIGYSGSGGNLTLPAEFNGKPVVAVRDGSYWMDGVFSGKTITNLIIPDSFTSIGNHAFRETQLKSLVIGNSVKTIGSDAFYYNELTSIIIPNSVTSVGSNAFSDNKLTSIAIGANVTVPLYSFDGYFENIYNDNGKTAGTYTRPDVNSTSWTKEN